MLSTRHNSGHARVVARTGLTSLLLLLAAACAGTQGRQAGPVCRYANTTIRADFPGGRLSGCRRTGTGAFTLYIAPERQPINPSPWYAFDIESTHSRALELTLDYGDFRHRYPPKVRAGSDWYLVPGPVATNRPRTRASFTIEVPGGIVRIAAQPVISASDSGEWVRALGAHSDLEAGVLGASAEGRPILQLSGGTAVGGTLVVIGRQHPPEVTGVWALRAFVERLAANDSLARQFRDRFGLLVVPLLNPDGVVHGNWRLDTAGTDLNRDWGLFTRPETRLVRDALVARRPILFVDFHSTRRDVLYVPSPELGIERAWFAPAWHAAINARMSESPMNLNSRHNPQNATLKNWASRELRVPAVTFEVGDSTSRSRAESLGRIAAEEAMRLLLHPPASPAHR